MITLISRFEFSMPLLASEITAQRSSFLKLVLCALADHVGRKLEHRSGRGVDLAEATFGRDQDESRAERFKRLRKLFFLLDDFAIKLNVRDDGANVLGHSLEQAEHLRR